MFVYSIRTVWGHGKTLWIRKKDAKFLCTSTPSLGWHDDQPDASLTIASRAVQEATQLLIYNQQFER